MKALDKRAAYLQALSGTTPSRLASAERLTGWRGCDTMYDMKTSTLTIRLDPDLEDQLDRLAKQSGRSRSEIARDALRRQLAVLQFEQARRQVMPFAEARGYLTDEDIFKAVS